MARLRINARPWAHVAIDGESAGGTTPWTHLVLPGHHTIELTYYPGGEPHGHSLVKTIEVDAVGGKVTDVDAGFAIP